MGEEPKGITFQPQAGQPADSASGTEPGGGTPQYFTKQEAEQLRQELERRLQSLNDKSATRIENRLAAKMAEIERTAKLLRSTPEQVAQAKQEALQQVLTEIPADSLPDASAQQAAQTAKQDQGTSSSQDAVNEMTAELEAEYGITLERGDPEAAILNEAKTRGQFYRKYQAALEAKKQRLSTSPQARIPSVMAGGNTPSEASMLAELDQLLAHPTPDKLPRIRELRAKLKK